MPPTRHTGKRVKEIVGLLPYDQVKHMAKVGVLADAMGKKIAENTLKDFEPAPYGLFGHAAFYHDIGKACIPPELLSKPGKLTTEETKTMQAHTLLAGHLFDQALEGVVSGIPAYLIAPARNAAVYHHEWWNGEGYPFGICAKEIPLIARVVAICDAYDAMTSARAYRRPYSHAFACDELLKYAGIQFDPVLVELFMENAAAFARLSAQAITAI